ncbi:hypothetical protein JCM3765_001766 [Sporobolomyces pararoseus]
MFHWSRQDDDNLVKQQINRACSSTQLPTPASTPTFLSNFAFSNLPPLPSVLPLSALPPLPKLPKLKVKFPVRPKIEQRTPPPISRLPPFPTSPSPRKPPSLPLDRLFRAGTIIVNGYRFDVDNELAEDGWISFSKDLLKRVPSPEQEEESSKVDSTMLDDDEPSQSPSKGKKRSRIGGGGGRASPAKKKPKVVLDKALANIISCFQASVLTATARAVGNDIILRIYLVPEDLPELGEIKSKLSRPADSIVRSVLQSIRCDLAEWNGTLNELDISRLMDENDRRSLLEVFHQIEVPGDGEFNDLEAPRAIKERIQYVLKTQSENVETELFDYQRASIAKMLARELAPALSVAPGFTERVSGIDFAKVFISHNGNVALCPPRFREPKSGILAEDMGVGKTLIILALIAETRSELPSLDGTSTWLDDFDKPVKSENFDNSSLPPSPSPLLLTRHSIDFPFDAERAERRRLRPRVAELLAPQILTVRELREHGEKLEEQRKADLEEDSHRPPLPSLRTLMINLIKTTSHPIRYCDHDDPILTGGDLLETLQTSPPFYRLLPSPRKLDSRGGRNEIPKPIEIVVAATTLLVVPTDLVRQWKQEIDKHLYADSLRVLVLRTSKDKFPSPQEMATYDVVLMSAARFTDAAETGDRSLRGVHWKRLVVDEGHVLSSHNSTRTLAQELRCECRWAVSGTPSTNLRGASVDGQLAAASNAAGGTRIDLDRLGQLYSGFLRHPAFDKPQTLRDLVGDYPSRVAPVFNQSFIRHPTSLVKPVLSIPPLSVRTTFIELEEAERKMYNALTAIFSSNAIQSQRVDQDYFFHKANAGPLKNLCSNLATASAFFASDEILRTLTVGVEWAQERLESEKASKWSEDDRVGLKKAIKVMKEALNDQEWKTVVNEVAVAIEVQGLDDEIIRAFGGLTATQNPLQRSLISLHQLVRLRQDLKELRYADTAEWKDDEELIEEVITFEARRKRYEVEIASRKSKDEEIESVFKKRSKKDTTPLVPLPSDSIFRNVQLIRTSSAKMNYLIDQLRSYPDDKFIIFCSSKVDLVFANLSEALDLFGIPHIIFAGSHARMGQDRGLKAQRFNTTSAKEVQAILVDVEKGGRGVGLTAASRVIMMEPIWKPDLELQATKRAHRLGQTKPVDLQILIVKDTYEDALLKRREQITKTAPEDFSKNVKVPQADSSLRTLLQSAKYLEPTDRAKEGKPISKAFLDPPVLLMTEGGHDVSRD